MGKKKAITVIERVIMHARLDCDESPVGIKDCVNNKSAAVDP